MLAWQAKFEYKKEKVYQPTVESFNFVAANFCGCGCFAYSSKCYFLDASFFSRKTISSISCISLVKDVNLWVRATHKYCENWVTTS